jgi:hypothetical protein
MALAAVQGIIVYQDWPQWWALPANVAILIMAGLLGAATGRPVTGRQQSLERGLRLET